MFDFEDHEGDGENGTGKAPDLSQAKVLGDTPHGTVYETANGFFCVPASNGSKRPIRLGKSICQCAIPAEQALKIFNEGKSDLFPRFISKKGKPFSAYLKLEGAKVAFEFGPQQEQGESSGD